jgi:hypothetical protein
MKDSLKLSFSVLKHIHYFFYYTGILTLPLLPIYPAIMLSLGIFSKITILQSNNNIIPLKRIICVTLYSYYNNYSITNIYVNLLLATIFLSIYICFFTMVKTNTIYNV